MIETNGEREREREREREPVRAARHDDDDIYIALSAGAVEYTDCFSAEG